MSAIMGLKNRESMKISWKGSKASSAIQTRFLAEKVADTRAATCWFGSFMNKHNAAVATAEPVTRARTTPQGTSLHLLRVQHGILKLPFPRLYPYHRIPEGSDKSNQPRHPASTAPTTRPPSRNTQAQPIPEANTRTKPGEITERPDL